MKYVLRGLSEGFRIGFQYKTRELQQSHRNMLITHPAIVSEYIAKEIEANRLAVFSPEEAAAAAIHCSPIGIIPKKSKPGKWCLYCRPVSSRKGERQRRNQERALQPVLHFRRRDSRENHNFWERHRTSKNGYQASIQDGTSPSRRQMVARYELGRRGSR